MSEDFVWISTFGLIHETEKAERHETLEGEMWIPKSVIHARKDGPYAKLEVRRWWAEKRGLTDGKDDR